jgi:hypothetical protein
LQISISADINGLEFSGGTGKVPLKKSLSVELLTVDDNGTFFACQQAWSLFDLPI